MTKYLCHKWNGKWELILRNFTHRSIFLFTLQSHNVTTMSHANVAWLTFIGRTKSGGALEIIRARFYRRCIILGGRASLSRGNEQRKRRTSHFTRLHSRCKFAKSSRATGSTMRSSPPLLFDAENARIRCRRWHTWNLWRCKASVAGTFPTVER